MDNNSHCRIILCVMILWVADAQVAVMTLSHLNNQQSFVCGKSETLICKTGPSVAFMSWRIDSSLAADCTNSVCTPYSPHASDYSFMANSPDGVFNMTKHIVRLSDNGTTFTCQDGSTSDQQKAYVKVVNDYESIDNKTSVHSTNFNKHVEFQVTTGCLEIATANKTTFKWLYKKANCPEDWKEYTNISSEQIIGIKNESDCVSDPDCGASGFTKKKSVLVITENEKGDTCNIEVVIDFGSKLHTVKFMTTVQLKDQCVEPETTTHTSTVSYRENFTSGEATTPVVQSSTVLTTQEAPYTSTSLQSTTENRILTSTKAQTKTKHFTLVYILISVVACGFLIVVFFLILVQQRNTRVKKMDVETEKSETGISSENTVNQEMCSRI